MNYSDNRKLEVSHFFWVLFALFTLSHVWSLLHSGIYWDDWVLIGIKPEIVRDDFFRNGRPFFGLLHELLLHAPATIFVYKILIFAGYFLASYLFFKILKKISFFEEKDVFILCALFTLLPYNSARHSIVILQYVVCLDLFLFAMLNVIQTKTTAVQKVVMFCSFVLSMYIEAFVLFTAILMALFWIFKIKKIKSCILPSLAVLFFLLLRYKIHPPQDIYLTLNTVQLSNILLSPLYLLHLIRFNFFAVFSESIRLIPQYAGLASILLTMPFLLYVMRRVSFNFTIHEYKKIVYFVLVGLILFFVAAFPFIIVGKEPMNYDWLTRSQFLLPVGCSFFIYFGSKLIFVEKIQNLVLIFVLCLSVHLNMVYGLEYWVDHIKQQSLKLNFEKQEKIKNATSFLVIDGTEHLNARDRTYRFYDYTPIFKEIFKDESRLAYRAQEPAPTRSDIEFGYMKNFYSLSDYTWSEPTHIIGITYSSLKTDNPESLFKMLYLSLQYTWNYSEKTRIEYEDYIKNLVKVDVLKIDRPINKEYISFIEAELAKK